MISVQYPISFSRELSLALIGGIMNILFYHGNGVLPYSRGVSGVILTLTSMFREKGHRVSILSVRNLDKEASYDIEQHFLPNTSVLSDENVSFFVNLVLNKKTDVLINMCIGEELSLAYKTQQIVEHSFSIVTCYHVLFLTPQKYYAYRKEYQLRKKGRSFLFHFLKSRLVRELLVDYYVFRHRPSYLFVIRHSDRVILLSEGHREEFIKMCGIDYRKKTIVIPNTVSLSSNPSTLKENGVLWVGNFDSDCKRPDIMLRIWKKVSFNRPDWKLTMVGSGPLWNEMKDLAQDLNLKNISFVGRVNSLPFFEAAKLYCCTSIHESFSLTTLEALSCGTVPLLFNSFPTASEIVEDGYNGVLVPPFNIDEYAERLSELMDNNEKRILLSDNRFRVLEKYSPSTIYYLWEQLFNSL